MSHQEAETFTFPGKTSARKKRIFITAAAAAAVTVNENLRYIVKNLI